MRHLRSFWTRLSGSFAMHSNASIERADDIAAELESHVRLQTAENIRRGMTPEEAHRQALLASGGVTGAAERVQQEYRFVWLEQVLADSRYAVRGLVARPLFAMVAITTLAVGVGVNVVMFGVLDRALVRAPRYLRDAASVHRIYLEWTGSDGQRRVTQRTEYPRFADLVRWNRSLSELAAFAYRRAAVGEGEVAREQDIAAVSANFFEFFNAPPVLGRYFTAAEDTPPVGAPVAVLGFDYWRSDYGGEQNVLGKSLRIGSVEHTIIGVAPRGFDGISDGVRPVVFVPATTYGASMRATYYNRYSWTYVALLGRRKPGVSVDAVNADLTNAFRLSWNAERGSGAGVSSALPERPTATAGPLQVDRGPQARPESRTAIWVGGIALVVLLIATANVANLQVARALRRRRELAVRRAIGGTPGRILQQVLVESVVLAVISGAAALIGAWFTAGVFQHLLFPDAQSWSVVTDARTTTFAAAVALVASILAGLIPALQGGGTDLSASLKAGFREISYRRSRTSSALLLVQTALCVVLLVGAGLFTQSLRHVRSVPLGYDAERLLYLQTVMRGTVLPEGGRSALAERLLSEIRTIPGVLAATTAISVPFRGGETQDLYVAGRDTLRRIGRFELQAGTPDYFATMGTRIVRGRGLSPADRAGTPAVAVLSQAMASVLWPDQDAIGKCIRIDKPDGPCTTVVGIAENIKTRGFDSDTEFHYYLPMSQYAAILGEKDAEMFIRVAGNPGGLTATLRTRLQPLMPGSSYVMVMPFQNVLDPAMRSWQSGARLFLAFGGLALLLAAIGLYAVIAFGVAQRTQEIGMRMALGARTGSVLRLIVGEGLRVTVAGVAIGATVALSSERSIGDLLFRVSPHDPVVYAAVTATLLLAALLACIVPALRAARIDPSVSLRTEC